MVEDGYECSGKTPDVCRETKPPNMKLKTKTEATGSEETEFILLELSFDEDVEIESTLVIQTDMTRSHTFEVDPGARFYEIKIFPTETIPAGTPITLIIENPQVV